MAILDITDLRRFQAPVDGPVLHHSALETTTSAIIDHYLLSDLDDELPANPTVHNMAARLREVDRIIEGHPVGKMPVDLEALPRVVVSHVYRPGDEDYPMSLTPLLDVFYRTRPWVEVPVDQEIHATLPLVPATFAAEVVAERTMITDLSRALPEAVVRPPQNAERNQVDRWSTNRVIRKAAQNWVRSHVVVRRELRSLHLPTNALYYLEGEDRLPGAVLTMTARTADGITKRYRANPPLMIEPRS